MRRTSFIIAAIAALCVGLAAPGFARDDQTTAVAGHTSRELPPSAVDSVGGVGLAIATSSARVAARTTAAAAGSSDYSCVRKTTATSALKAATPDHIDVSSSDWEIHYTDMLYQMANARVVSGLRTTQWEQCVIGGSRNKHFYQRMANTESEVSIAGSTNYLIGYKWGTAVSSGDVKATLGFKVGLSSATSISGSLPLTTGGHEAGSVGSGLCGKVGTNSGNEVNGAWNYTYPGYGTNDFKGNVAHALYEFPSANKTTLNYYFNVCRRARY